MANDQVSVEISIEEKQALKALTALTKGVDRFEKTTKKSVGVADKAMASFAGNLAAVASAKALGAVKDGLTELVVGSINVAASFEKINTQLEVLTGSSEIAASLFQELQDFSAKTPFQLQGIAESSAQLLSFGFEASTVTERIKRIGEVAAGSGSDLKEISLIYGQVAAAGKLTGERLLQLQERAIPIGPAIAKTMGVAESSVRDLVSQGKVTQDVFVKAFNSMSEAGGIFEGAIDKQSQTIDGTFSTLSDNFSLLQAEIGKIFAPATLEGARALTKIFQDLIPTVKNVASVTKTWVDYLTADDAVGEARAKIAGLKATMEDVKATTDNVNSVLGEDSWLGRINRSRADSRIARIKEEMNGLYATLKTQGVDLIAEETASAERAQRLLDEKARAKVESEKQISTKVLEERAKLNDQLLLLEQDLQLKQSEAKLMRDDITAQDRELEINRIKEFELAKNEIKFNSEIESAQKIQDIEAKNLAVRIANNKKYIADTTARAKAQKTIQDMELANHQQMVSGFAQGFGILAGAAKRGTAEYRATATTEALISTYLAANKALALGPPVGPFLAAAYTLRGLKNVQEINKASFANGGVFGGFTGATSGGDTTTANVRTGEMILNASQQRQLFDVANKRSQSETQERNIEITSIVQIDEREVARAVRNQRLEGFAI